MFYKRSCHCLISILSGQRSISEAECAQEVWDSPLSSSSGSTAPLMLREFEIPAVGSTPAVEISLTPHLMRC
jgi:hypothetical protein